MERDEEKGGGGSGERKGQRLAGKAHGGPARHAARKGGQRRGDAPEHGAPRVKSAVFQNHHVARRLRNLMTADGERHQPARALIHEKGARDEHAVDEIVEPRPRHHGGRRRAARVALCAPVMPVMREDALENQKEHNRAQHDETEIVRLDAGHFKGLRDEVRERDRGEQPAGDRQQLLGESRKPAAGKQCGDGDRENPRQNACGKDV